MTTSGYWLLGYCILRLPAIDWYIPQLSHLNPHSCGSVSQLSMFVVFSGFDVSGPRNVSEFHKRHAVFDVNHWCDMV